MTMKMKGIVYLIVTFPLLNVSCFLNSDIIVGFSQSKKLTMGTIFNCMKQKEKVILSKAIMQHSLQFLSVDLNNCGNNFETALYSTRHLAVVVDGDCENITALINEELDKKYFFDTFHWLILATGKSKGNVLHHLNKAKLNINSEVHVTVCNEDVNNNNCTIYDVYNPASEHGGKLRINVIGFYNINGYEARRTENKYWLRRNMTGVTFKTAVVLPRLDMPLMEYINNDENRQINSMHRFQTVCVNYCRDFFNFSLLIQRTNSWGYVQADGHFDGLVSLLERKIVDFGSSPLIFKLDRLPVVDYSYGNWILRSTFIYRRPKVVAESYQIFLRPLAKWVWVCILVVMVVMVLATKIVFSHELTSTHSARNGLDSTWSFLCLFTFGAFCQQGAIVFPKLFSSRILSIFVYLFCILIYQFYSAAIVSYLLMDPPRTINNLKDLTESELRVGIEDILIDRNYFVQTTDPDAIGLFEKKIKGATNESGFYAPAQGLELVRKGGFAFHVETSTAYPIIEATFSNEHICELEEVQMYRTQPMYTNLPKESPFKEMMNYCMYKLAENGNMDRLRKHWDARKPACIESAKKTVIHVSLREFKCGPLSLAYGMCFAMVFIVLEIVICYRRVVMERVKAKVQATLPSLYPYLN